MRPRSLAKNESFLTILILAAAAFFLTNRALVAKEPRRPLPALPGYEAVPVQYNSSNKMLLEVLVNGHRASFVVDTGANISLLSDRRANALGVTATKAGSPYGEFATLNGSVRCRIGYIASLRAGSMDFGGGPMALFSRANAGPATGSLLPLLNRDDTDDGLFGTDILTGYKAIINCFTKTIFFKTGSSAHPQIASFAASQHFIRVPLRKETNGALTVPASVNGHPCRLVVDTGSAITTFDLRRAKEFGLSLTETGVTGGFAISSGHETPVISLSEVANLMIGDYHVPPQKLAVEELPGFALEQGQAHVAGILGLEYLRSGRAIIDFDSMSVFLK